MCRLLAYVGQNINLDKILYKPQHSLVVQSYQPREMTAGLLNADGFGLGWYHHRKQTNPYTYKNILPIWNDINLPQISRYVESGCILGYVRSATPPLAVDFSNCQPFTTEKILFIHNGFVQNFRQTLHRPIRKLLKDYSYDLIKGATDSEHIFALIVNQLETNTKDLATALDNSLNQLKELALEHEVNFSANVIISDGKQLVASRYALGSVAPTLYWLKDDFSFPGSVIVASEPLFKANWNSCPDKSLTIIGEDLEVNLHSLGERRNF